MKATLLLSILAQRRFLIAALISLAAYVVLYLAAMQYLVISPGDSLLSLEILPDWRSLALRQRGPFLFEPVGVLHVASLAIFLSIPNLAIALALGLLVAANVAASYYGFHALGMRGQLTATVASVWSWLVPASAVLLVMSLWWSLRRMVSDGVCDIGPVGGAKRAERT